MGSRDEVIETVGQKGGPAGREDLQIAEPGRTTMFQRICWRYSTRNSETHLETQRLP